MRWVHKTVVPLFQPYGPQSNAICFQFSSILWFLFSNYQFNIDLTWASSYPTDTVPVPCGSVCITWTTFPFWKSQKLSEKVYMCPNCCQNLKSLLILKYYYYINNNILVKYILYHIHSKDYCHTFSLHVHTCQLAHKLMWNLYGMNTCAFPVLSMWVIISNRIIT